MKRFLEEESVEGRNSLTFSVIRREMNMWSKQIQKENRKKVLQKGADSHIFGVEHKQRRKRREFIKEKSLSNKNDDFTSHLRVIRRVRAR